MEKSTYWELCNCDGDNNEGLSPYNKTNKTHYCRPDGSCSGHTEYQCPYCGHTFHSSGNDCSIIKTD